MSGLNRTQRRSGWEISDPLTRYILLPVLLFLTPLASGQVQQSVSGIVPSRTIAQVPSSARDWQAADTKLAEHIRKARREIRRNPRSAQAYLSLGFALQSAGETSGSAEAIDRALELDDHLAQGWYMQGLMAADSMKWALAIENFRRALALNPQDIAARMGLTEMLLRNGDFSGASREVQVVLQQNPLDSRAHYGLGRVKMQEGNLAEAEAEFRRALAIEPAFPEAEEGLGEALFGRHRWREAAQSFERVLAAQPDSLHAHTGLAGALARLGDDAAARKHFAKSREISNREVHLERAKAENNRGLELWSRGDLKGAAAALRSALKEDPDFAEAHNNLGAVLWKQKDMEGALAEFSAAVRSQPDFAKAHNNLGSAFLQTDQVAQAAEEFEKALSLQPGFASAHFNLGVLLGKIGQRSQAEAELRRAIVLQPEMASAHIELGLLLASPEGKLTTEAQAELNEGIRLSPQLNILVPERILRQLP